MCSLVPLAEEKGKEGCRPSLGLTIKGKMTGNSHVRNESGEKAGSGINAIPSPLGFYLLSEMRNLKFMGFYQQGHKVMLVMIMTILVEIVSRVELGSDARPVECNRNVTLTTCAL